MQLAPTLSSLAERYTAVRRVTEDLAAPLATEDTVVQSMPDVSPTKWHLAHTSWFFETFLLAQVDPSYKVFDPAFGHLFNSYYNSIGPMHAREQRGLLSRPTLDEILEYRSYVDRHVVECFGNGSAHSVTTAFVLTLGLNHEQQHQELILTDIKHVFSCNPLRPAYHERSTRDDSQADTAPDAWQWLDYPGGVYEVGHAGTSFAFDNESPRHRELLTDFRVADRPVVNGDYRAFIHDGGYEQPTLWLSDGWATVKRQAWEAPLYWENRDGQWQVFTLRGMMDIDDREPVCHLSYYEADAYARWAGARLPDEREWEIMATAEEISGNTLESGALHPCAVGNSGHGPRGVYGDTWEWTRSPYSAYPGYNPGDGALGEYNGKFMSSQMVLRGGSCVTALDHIRATYRNFFPAHARWQFSGLRLASDA